MKKLFFIYNIHAGVGKIKQKLAEIIDIFTAEGYLVTAWSTQYRGDATRVVKELGQEYDLIVGCGGDGTLDEIVSGMMCKEPEMRIPIGYIPAGSTNDFGRSLGIPVEMKEAAHMIMGGRKFGCDIGEFGGKNFVYVAAFGLFTEVSYQTDQQMKNAMGYLAYLMEGVKSLTAITGYKMRFRSGDIEDEGEFLYGMITNAMSVGGFNGITGKDVILDDGLFEVILIKMPKNLMELNEVIQSLAFEREDEQYILRFKTGHLEIESETEVPWTLDGEFGGNHRNVVMDNRQRALEFIVQDITGDPENGSFEEPVTENREESEDNEILEDFDFDA